MQVSIGIVNNAKLTHQRLQFLWVILNCIDMLQLFVLVIVDAMVAFDFGREILILRLQLS